MYAAMVVFPKPPTPSKAAATAITSESAAARASRSARHGRSLDDRTSRRRNHPWLFIARLARRADHDGADHTGVRDVDSACVALIDVTGRPDGSAHACVPRDLSCSVISLITPVLAMFTPPLFAVTAAPVPIACAERCAPGSAART